MQASSLVISGSGIKSIAHLTVEAKSYIEQYDRVYYLVNEPVLEEWIQQQNVNSESLYFLYDKLPDRISNYRAMGEYVAENLASYHSACLVLYGHPFVFCDIAFYAAKAAKKKGYNPFYLAFQPKTAYLQI